MPAWFRDLSPHLDPLLARITKEVICPDVMEEECKVAGHKKVAATTWDIYAMKTLNGRMLVGCCHLDCRNMRGCSEAALPTLICGGCRKVHYCSVECKRAAWAAGGHSMECRKDSHRIVEGNVK